MECTGRCVAVSEPNSPSIVATKYRKYGDSSELRQLARDVIRWECRPYPTMQPPPLGYIMKLIAPCVNVFPMLRQSHSGLLLSMADPEAITPTPLLGVLKSIFGITTRKIIGIYDSRHNDRPADNPFFATFSGFATACLPLPSCYLSLLTW